MYRYKFEDLIAWKNSKNKQPLIIRGARQVGKTWLMKEFGKMHYKNVAYIHFDNNSRMEELFKGDLAPKKIIEGLQIETGEKIEPKETLIIFDEIQEVPRALTALKYFQEEAPEYDIIAAGSLLRSSITQRNFISSRKSTIFRFISFKLQRIFKSLRRK